MTRTLQRPLSGTLLGVLSPGGGGQPWRGLVQPSGGERQVCLVLQAAPGDIQPGDDLHLRGVWCQGDDARFPDEVYAADVWAATGPAEDACIIEPSLGQQAANGRGLAAELGLPTLAQLASQGALQLHQSGGTLVVGRARQPLDPAIAWVMRRFDDPASNALRGIGTLYLDPATLLAVRQRPPVTWVNALLAPLRNREAERQDEQQQRARQLAAMLPVLLLDSQREPVAAMLAQSRALFQASGQRASAGVGHLGIVAPYPAQQTSHLFWQDLTGSHGLPLMPRDFIPKAALSKLVAAHETGHAYGAAFDHGDDAGLRAETFADAVAILSYVGDTGDVAAARQLGMARSMAVLFGISTHATGPGCKAALQRAIELRQQHQGGAIPVMDILVEADRIARHCCHPEPNDLRQMHALLCQASQGFQALGIDAIAELVESVLAREQYTLTKPTETARMFRAAVAAMAETTFTAADLDDPALFAEALRVERDDLADTLRHLAAVGLGAMGRDVIGQLRAALHNPPAGAVRPVPGSGGASSAAGGAIPSSTLLERLRQAARNALLGPSDDQREPSPAWPRLARAREAQLCRAEAEHAALFVSGQNASGGLVMLPGGETNPAPSFALSVPERVQRLQALATAALAMRDVALCEDGQQQEAGDICRALQEVAWTLRVQHPVWQEMCATLPEAALLAVETAAAASAGQPDIMQDAAALTQLALLQMMPDGTMDAAVPPGERTGARIH